MAYLPPLNGGRINASIGGNTGGTASARAVSTGTVMFAGGNNVTLSQSTNSGGATISFHGGAGTLGLYGLGNTTQNSSTSLDGRSVSFNGLGAMSVGYSNGSVQLSAPIATSISATGILSMSTTGATVSIGVPAYSAGISTIGNTSGTTGFASNRFVLAGGNNITLSQSTGTAGNTLSISAANQSIQTQNMVSFGGSTGNIVVSNANNVTFGAAGSTVTASASFSQTIQTQGLQSAIAGTSTATSGAISFANSNGVSFGLSNGTLTASAAGGGAGGSVSAGGTNYTNGVSLSALGALTLSGTNNQTLSLSVPSVSSLSATGAVSISVNASTISIGVPAYSAGISTIGNTSGTTGFASNRFVLAGGNNITLSQATGAGGNTLSIIGGAGGAGGSVSAGGTNYTNGVSLSALGALTISGTSNQTLSLSVPSVSSLSGTGILSISTNGGTISIGVPAYSAGMGTGGNTSGTTGLASNQLVLAGGNNITLSQATGAGGNTLSIIGGAGGGGGGGVALSPPGTTYTSGTVGISAVGPLGISTTNNQTLSLTAPAMSSIVGINGISLTTNGNTLSIDGAALKPGTLSNWEPVMLQHASLASGQMSTKNMVFHKLTPQANVTATQLLQLISAAQTMTSVSHRGTLSIQAGIYSANGSTLSLITQSSGSASYSWTLSSTNGSTFLSGLRGLTLPINMNAAPGNYWIGIWSNSTYSSTNIVNVFNLFVSNYPGMPVASLYGGPIGQAALASQGIQEAVGAYSVTQSALMASAAMSGIIQNAASRLSVPYLNFKATSW